jgi:hypothetical protein
MPTTVNMNPYKCVQCGSGDFGIDIFEAIEDEKETSHYKFNVYCKLCQKIVIEFESM